MTDSPLLIPAQNSDDVPAENIIPAVPPLLGRRKSGAPRGNTNALKHGFYSHTFSNSEIDRLDNDVRGEFRDEEAYLRVLLARTAESIKDRELETDEGWVALRAVSLAVGRIESLHRSRKAIYDNQTALDKVWEELKYIPVEDDHLEEE